MKLLDLIHKTPILADGAMGTMLQSMGLAGGRSPEQWNIDRPDSVRAVHDAYIAAGAQLISSNTFGANALRQRRSKRTAAELARAGMQIARDAANAAERACFAALDVGPLGTFLAPLGTTTFEEAVALFREPIEAAADLADCVLIETMGDVQEAAAAVQAAKSAAPALPVFLTMSFDANGRLLSGASLEQAVAELIPLGIDVFGCNCGVGPAAMREHLSRLRAVTQVPIAISPNAGLPRYENGATVFALDAPSFAAEMRDILFGGARICGGCCGTTPDHIRALGAIIRSNGADN